MDGEFLVQESLGIEKGVAGGNLILQADSIESGLAAVRRATEALDACSGVIAPFPGGVARSGSKVGSRYKKLKASTADAYCPTLRGRVESALLDGVNCAYEIVLDGDSREAVSPVQALAFALASCMASDVVLILTRGRQPLEGLTARLHAQRAEKDPRRLLRVELRFEVQGGVPPDKLLGKGAEFVAKYREKYGAEPEAYAIYGYVAGQVAIDALRRAGVKDRAALVKAVAETKQVDGPLGSWSFDGNGDTTLMTMSGNIVRDGKFEFVTLLGI